MSIVDSNRKKKRKCKKIRKASLVNENKMLGKLLENRRFLESIQTKTLYGNHVELHGLKKINFIQRKYIFVIDKRERRHHQTLECKSKTKIKPSFVTQFVQVTTQQFSVMALRSYQMLFSLIKV